MVEIYEIIMHFTMKEHSTTHLLRIHCRSLFGLLTEQRKKDNGNSARLHMWGPDFTFSANGFQEINNCSSFYSFQDHFKNTWVSESLCVYLIFTLWFNSNLNETIIDKYRNKKKRKKKGSMALTGISYIKKSFLIF